MSKSRLSAALYLLLVFLSGALVGTFAYRLYSMRTVSAGEKQPRPTPEERRRHYVDELTARTKMDEAQVAKLNEILDEAKTSFIQLNSKLKAEGQAIQNHQVEEINSILRPDQQAAYAAFRAEREKFRQQHAKQLNK